MSKKFRVVIGSDDAGFQYKEILKKQLQNDTNVESVVDVGVDATSKTPYPDVAIAAAQMIADGKADRALLICGTGLGVAISANKVKGIRAALVWSIETAKLAREHNNANVIAVGGRMHEADFVKQLIDTFIATPFPGDERHVRRIEKVGNYEVTGDL